LLSSSSRPPGKPSRPQPVPDADLGDDDVTRQAPNPFAGGRPARPDPAPRQPSARGSSARSSAPSPPPRRPAFDFEDAPAPPARPRQPTLAEQSTKLLSLKDMAESVAPSRERRRPAPRHDPTPEPQTAPRARPPTGKVPVIVSPPPAAGAAPILHVGVLAGGQLHLLDITAMPCTLGSGPRDLAVPGARLLPGHLLIEDGDGCYRIHAARGSKGVRVGGARAFDVVVGPNERVEIAGDTPAEAIALTLLLPGTQVLVRQVAPPPEASHRAAGSTITVGRLGCDINLLDAQVQPRHLEVSGTSAGHLVVRAAGEAIFTVNGRKVKEAEVGPDDLVQIGGTMLQLCEERGRQAGLARAQAVLAAPVAPTTPTPGLTPPPAGMSPAPAGMAAPAAAAASGTAAAPADRGPGWLARAGLSLRRPATVVPLLLLVAAGLSAVIETRSSLQGDCELVTTRRSWVRSEGGGVIHQVLVREGDRVKKGQVVVQMSTLEIDREVRRIEQTLREARAALSQLKRGPRPEEIKVVEARLRRARTRLGFASRNAARAQKLVADGVYSREAGDSSSREAALAGTEADIAARELAQLRAGASPEELEARTATVSRLEGELSYLEKQRARQQLASPSDGVVVTPRLDELGARAVPAGTEILQVVDDSAYAVEISIPEKSMVAVKAGDPVTVRLRSRPQDAITARVREVLPRVSETQAGRFILIRADLPDRPTEVIVGMTGAAVIRGERRSVLGHLTQRLGRWLRLDVL
jgi:HlyD family secretion protein